MKINNMSNTLSHGNSWSNGNNRSHGNSWSNGNNCSDGNSWSLFMFYCRGTHKSILCKDEEGIAYKVLNQQLTSVEQDDFYNKLSKIIGSWLPFVTNYCLLKDSGWHKKHDEKNEHISEVVLGDKEPCTKQYHQAWVDCPHKEAIIKLIKSSAYLKTEGALKVFTEITGIEAN